MSYNWEEEKQVVIFNNGKAGEVTCTASLRDTTGETGPNGNPLPPYMLTLKDSKNVDAEGNPKTIEVPYYLPVEPTEGDSKGLTRLRATMQAARYLYEAMTNSTNLPTADTSEEAFKAVMNACIQVGQVQVRAFVHYEKGGKPHSFLSMLTGFKRGIVSASNTSFVFPETNFMVRPPKANTETVTTTTEATEIDALFGK